MPRKPDLSTSLRNAAGSRPGPAPVNTGARSASAAVPPSRVGTVSLTIHVPATVRNQLKRLALDRGTTLHAICGEAFNMLFAREGQPEIAPVEPKRRALNHVAMDT
jgi:hypothetical protein